MGKPSKDYAVPLWEKANLTIYEAAAYSGIGADKTIVCGHWHTSYGHSKYEHKGTEFGEDADFSPYYGPGIIAIDACTAFSGKVNCLVIED